MSTDTTLTGMSQNDKKEILWGRPGSEADFFGVDLLAEAIGEVISKMSNFDRLRNFVPFDDAFCKHTLTTDIRIDSDGYTCFESSLWRDRSRGRLSSIELCRVWGLGVFAIEYELIDRHHTEIPDDLITHGSWVSKQEWDDEISIIEEMRKSTPDAMPQQQIAGMVCKRLFLTQSGKLFVADVELKPVKLVPSVYYVHKYHPTDFKLEGVYGLRDDSDAQLSLQDLMTQFTLEAGTGLLTGLSLMLQGSNYRVQDELDHNLEAEQVAKALLTRIKT
jgi:hypothetical protein